MAGLLWGTLRSRACGGGEFIGVGITSLGAYHECPSNDLRNPPSRRSDPRSGRGRREPTNKREGAAMGMLCHYLGQIRELDLDHAIAHFCHGEAGPGDDSDIREFLAGFAASFPDATGPANFDAKQWVDASE